MKYIGKKISKIVDELTTYMFSIGATDISINIKETEQDFKITLKCDYKEDKNGFEDLIKALNLPKEEEVEGYYWELTGETYVGKELLLVGMMIDKAEITWSKDVLNLTLYRNK